MSNEAMTDADWADVSPSMSEGDSKLRRVCRAQAATIEALRGEVLELACAYADLQAQLPEGMQHCTIKFIECPKGHGRLTATNWEQKDCHWCRIEDLEEDPLDRALRALASS